MEEEEGNRLGEAGHSHRAVGHCLGSLGHYGQVAKKSQARAIWETWLEMWVWLGLSLGCWLLTGSKKSRK